MPPRLRLLAIGLCFVTFLGLSTEGIAMSFFSRPTQEFVICSEMQGKLTFQGKPAAGAKIVRWSAWKDHDGESETFYADEHGHFLLPEKRDIHKKGPLDFLAQFVGKQLVTVTYQGMDYEIWYSNKFEPNRDSEYGGAPSEFFCELTDEVVHIRKDHANLTTSCKWDVIKGH